MRTSIDIPDALMAQVRVALSERNITFREAVIEGLRRTLLHPGGTTDFTLRDASFKREAGFAPGFGADALTQAIREDGEQRMVAEDPSTYRRDRR